MKGVSPIKKKFWQLKSRDVSNLIIVLIGILFYVALSNFPAIQLRLNMFLNVISPFMMGFAIAYLLNTPVRFFESKVFRKLRWKRSLSIAAVYLLALLVLVILINMILPEVVASVMALFNNLDTYMKNLNNLVDSLIVQFNLEEEGLKDLMGTYEDLLTMAGKAVYGALPKLLNYGMAVGNGVIAAVTALISSVYMLSGKKKLTSQLKSILFAVFPVKKVEHFLGICCHANEIFVGFINGKIIDSAIMGVLCFILCSIFRIPFALLISMVIGVTNIVPFFGPIIGAIPSMMILLVVDPLAALRFGILVIALQQFDGNILGPKILGNSTGISAIWVLVAIVVGGGLFGFPGMLLGVPTFAVIYMLTKDFVSARLAAKGIGWDGKPLPSKQEGAAEEATDENEEK